MSRWQLKSAIFRGLKWLLRPPADALLASSRKLPAKFQKYYPYPSRAAAPGVSVPGYLGAGGLDLYILRKSTPNGQECGEDGLPIPPQYLRAGYGATVEIWLNGGKSDIDNMMTLLNSSDFFVQKGNRILDFGCGPGRMIRWLAGLAEQCEVWGVDVSARHIVWCQENLSPPFNFATVTTLPHLPFEDNYFDLIYCGSIFTHIDDLADAWLLEVKRIARPGGRIYITVHDKHTADLVINRLDLTPYAGDLREFLLPYKKYVNLVTSDYYKLSISPGDPESQVFYDIDYLRQHWGRILKFISVTPEAYGYQTAVLLEK
jgi:SAM-dependent methyltransferase